MEIELRNLSKNEELDVALFDRFSLAVKDAAGGAGVGRGIGGAVAAEDRLAGVPAAAHFASRS